MTTIADSHQPSTASANPALAANKRLALEFLQAAFANRLDEAGQKLSPAAVWWVIGRSERLKVSGHKNRAQIGRLLQALARAVPAGMQIEVRSITAEDDRVSVEVAAQGSWINGRDYRNTYHFLLELRDGFILSVREYMDTLHLLEVLED